MRRDVCYFFPANVKTVYEAYLSAATNAPFRRDCRKEPYHTLSFGMNYSLKYNMNGGSCTLHFIPYQSGTAVDLRFSIAQLAGARYERYAEDLTNLVSSLLRLNAQKINLDLDRFLEKSNQVTPQTFVDTSARPVIQSAQGGICTKCGNQLAPNASFCSTCGTRVAPRCKYCTRCGRPSPMEAAFCTGCGNKL